MDEAAYGVQMSDCRSCRDLIDNLDEIYVSITTFLKLLSRYNEALDDTLVAASFGDQRVTLGDLRQLERSRQILFEMAQLIVKMGRENRDEFTREKTKDWSRPHESEFLGYVRDDLMGPDTSAKNTAFVSQERETTPKKPIPRENDADKAVLEQLAALARELDEPIE